jgi:hypothetical protein
LHDHNGPVLGLRQAEHRAQQLTDDAEDISEVFALVTDLLDVEAHPALDLACVYPMRWGWRR